MGKEITYKARALLVLVYYSPFRITKPQQIFLILKGIIDL